MLTRTRADYPFFFFRQTIISQTTFEPFVNVELKNLV